MSAPHVRRGGSAPAAASTVRVEDRDAAVLAAVKASSTPLQFDALLRVMPIESMTPDAQREALSKVLTRLRVKKLIQSNEDGWVAA